MYTFLEPNRGVSQRTEEICVLIVEGVLADGAVLTVTPRWVAGTASGECISLACPIND